MNGGRHLHHFTIQRHPARAGTLNKMQGLGLSLARHMPERSVMCRKLNVSNAASTWPRDFRALRPTERPGFHRVNTGVEVAFPPRLAQSPACQPTPRSSPVAKFWRRARGPLTRLRDPVGASSTPFRVRVARGRGRTSSYGCGPRAAGFISASAGQLRRITTAAAQIRRETQWTTQAL